MNQAQIHPGTDRLGQEVARYLATGESDPIGLAYPGDNTVEHLTRYDHNLRGVLLAEVRLRERGRRQSQAPPGLGSPTWVRRKVEPMMTGLFPSAERKIVLGLAERSVIFLTREATRRTIRGVPECVPVCPQQTAE